MTKREETKAIAKRLRLARQQNEISQPELAAKIGMSKQAVSSWENGTAALSALQLIDFAKILGVESSWLLTGKRPYSSSQRGERAGLPFLESHDIVDLAAKRLELQNVQRVALDTSSFSSEGFAVAIEDQSMSPQLVPGDVAIVDRGKPVEQGDVVLAVLFGRDGNQTVSLVRQISFLIRTSTLPMILAPISPDWPIHRVDQSDDASVIGPIVGLIRRRL